MNRRTFVVAAVAWVLVVTLGSGLVWAVVSRAGQGVVSATDPVAGDSSPAVVRATQAVGEPSEPSASHRTHDGDDDHGKHHDGGDDGGDDGPDDRTPGGAQPTSGATSAGSGGDDGSGGGNPGGSGTRTGNPSPSPDDGPASVSRTWSGAAGTVKVECTAAKISLVSAYPNDGYRFEVGDNGPEHVEVEFENTSTERQTKVEATCSAGTPTFRVESDSESGSDD